MSDFIFRIQPNIILGSYTTSRLGQYAHDYGSRFMLILDPILKEVGAAEKLSQSLTNHKIEFFTFDEINTSADTQIISNALTLAKEAHIHGVIAAGGTKVLNVARAVCALYNETHDVYTYVDGATPTAGAIPLICVPTTMRDSSLFTDRTPVVDSRSSQVKLLKIQNGLCKLALFDPNLSVTLTENQMASMSIETLCLAVESYLSQKASFFSDMLVEKAIELLSYAIDGSPTLTVVTPQEILLAQGGCMASLATAASSLGTASLLSLCINARYNISRSLTTAIMFPYIIEDSAKFRTDRLAKIARLLRAAPAEVEDTVAVSSLAEYVRQHLAKANLPTRLKELSVTIEQLAMVAEDASHLEIMNSLPRSMTADDLFDLLKQAF